jgi:hypothetical protein
LIATGVTTDYKCDYIPKEPLPSRLGFQNNNNDISSIIGSPTLVAHSPTPTPSNVGSPSAASRRKAKQDLAGPCCHCGAVSSPQWRKGPKGKPILCNACGIRFLRTRTLGKAMVSSCTSSSSWHLSNFHLQDLHAACTVNLVWHCSTFTCHLHFIIGSTLPAGRQQFLQVH